MTYAFEEGVKPTEKGTPVPFHPGLKLFSFNKPCATCRSGANMEFHGVRICGFDYVRRNKK
jgi:hypothetical protein